MYANQQLSGLFEAISDLYDSAHQTGCSDDLTVVEQVCLSKVIEECRRLRELKQSLLAGLHTHRFGETVYAYLHAGQDFAEPEFIKALGDDFEEHREEGAQVFRMPDEEVCILSDAENPESSGGDELSRLADTGIWCRSDGEGDEP